MTPPPVVVVGGGPAGLVAALSLLDAGYAPEEVLVVERRAEVARRWNAVQLAGLSLAKLDTWRAPGDGGVSVLGAMFRDGVLSLEEDMVSRMEKREGKARSERGTDIDGANPCERVVDLKVNFGGGKEWKEGKFQWKEGLTYKQVQKSLGECPYAIYIRDIEEHLLEVVVAKGVTVAFACETKLAWDEAAAKYAAKITRRAAKQPQDIALLPLDTEVDLGVPALVVVAEGGGRNLLKSQGVLARHGVDVKIKSAPKYFAAALTRHPKPSSLIPRTSVLGGTIYFNSPDQYQKDLAIVSGNIIVRAPRYIEMEKEGKELPPDTWYLRVPNDDLAMERLPHNINGQDFGIVESNPTDNLATWVTGNVRRLMAAFCEPGAPEDVEFLKIARPFTQADTILDKCAMGNVAVFGDAARTGHFVSGMGMNSIISIDSQAIVTLAKALRSGADPAASFSAYSKSILDTAKAWHTATHPLHNEKWPGWVPDADHAAPRVGGELAGPVRTEIRLASLDGFVRYVLANLALNYLVPFGFLRRWVRSVAEWAFSSGVQRIEYVPKKA